MKILFCKISGMKYYKGHCRNDVPVNGGKYVAEYGYGHEEFNFLPVEMEDTGERQCMGFVEPKSNRGVRNSLHIERIEGCSALKQEQVADDVLVVWCATRTNGDTTVVGWYHHASVWRNLQEWTLRWSDGTAEERCYNVSAKASDCVLLPEGERNRGIWSVPSAHYNKKFGFGQAMVWYANEPEAQQYLDNMIANIEAYTGENWLDQYPIFDDQ